MNFQLRPRPWGCRAVLSRPVRASVPSPPHGLSRVDSNSPPCFPFSVRRTAGKNLRKRGNQNSAQTDGRPHGRRKDGERARQEGPLLLPPLSLSPMLRIRFSAPPLSFGASIKIWKAERERETEQGNRENWGLCSRRSAGIRMVREGSAVVGLNASPGALDDYRGFDPSIVCGLPPPRRNLVGARLHSPIPPTSYSRCLTCGSSNSWEACVCRHELERAPRTRRFGPLAPFHFT